MTQALLPWTGPVYLFTGTGGSGSDPEFLGTAEECPVIDFFPVLVPVFNDIAGERPFDRQDHGEEGVVSLMTDRWDEAVYQRCVKRTVGVIGRKSRAEMGQFIVQGGPVIGGVQSASYGFRLWCVFPFGGGGNAALTSAGLHDPQTSNTAQGMPAGYRFLAATLERHGKPRTGTRSNGLLLQFRCMPVYQYAVSTGSELYRAHVLYDQDCSGLPNVA